ncbi:MAG: terminase TerL endonuclease subunit, partial [Bacteroides sp.]
YENEYQKALLTSEDMMTFRTKLLNIFVQDKTNAWLTQDDVSALAIDLNLKRITGYPNAMVSVDLSVSDDFSAVTYTIHDSSTYKFYSYTDYYIPEVLLTTHPNKNLYQRWVDNGHLKVCPGNVINYDMISDDILENNQYVKILQIGYDPYKSLEFVNRMSALGNKKSLVPVSQLYGTFTSPVESMEYAVKTSNINFANNPITWYCFGNAIIDEDRMENKKPIKRSKNAKIDGVITNLMNLYLFNNFTRFS